MQPRSRYARSSERGLPITRSFAFAAVLVATSCASRVAPSEKAVPAVITPHVPAARSEEDEVVSWVREAAIPIASTDPAYALDDLVPLGAIVGSARVVAVGEATHGTREFFQIKHRVLEYLVARQGFTVFAIEANYPESLAVNEYVLHGTGDARQALAGLRFWTVNTTEVLALIEWMRSWNADASHPNKVKFFGFDMQTARLGVRNVIDYLARVAPSAAKTAAAALAPLDEAHESSFGQLAPESRAAVARTADEFVARFDREGEQWITRSSRADWTAARQNAIVIGQAARNHDAPPRANWRDESMAENIRSLLDHEPAGARMLVWAHNAHVNVGGESAYDGVMGARLASALGDDYLAVGMVFERGAFQAWSLLPGHTLKSRSDVVFGSVNVGQAPSDDVAATFHRAGKPLFAIDLRRAPAGAVAHWLATPHAMREIGSVYVDLEKTDVLARRFHAVIYVDETTAARSIAPP